MAAKTPSTLTQLRAGATNYAIPQTGVRINAAGVSNPKEDWRSGQILHFLFPDIDTGDTWASGISGIKDFTYRGYDAATIRVTLSGSTFTFTTSAADQRVKLTILVGS